MSPSWYLYDWRKNMFSFFARLLNWEDETLELIVTIFFSRIRRELFCRMKLGKNKQWWERERDGSKNLSDSHFTSASGPHALILWISPVSSQIKQSIHYGLTLVELDFSSLQLKGRKFCHPPFRNAFNAYQHKLYKFIVISLVYSLWNGLFFLFWMETILHL